jgi:hypothetical protein
MARSSLGLNVRADFVRTFWAQRGQQATSASLTVALQRELTQLGRDEK